MAYRMIFTVGVAIATVLTVGAAEAGFGIPAPVEVRDSTLYTMSNCTGVAPATCTTLCTNLGVYYVTFAGKGTVTLTCAGVVKASCPAATGQCEATRPTSGGPLMPGTCEGAGDGVFSCGHVGSIP